METTSSSTSALSRRHSICPASRSARPVPLLDRSYWVTRHLFVTASVELPSWVSAVAAWIMVAKRRSWIGFIAVCDNEWEIRRMGRRDIVVALCDTSTCLEWVENFRTGLVPIDDDGNNSPKVECGFRSLYKTAVRDEPSLLSAVVEEVKKLTEQYAGQEISITLAGTAWGQR
ncbi:phospholipase A1-Ibeta2, chloroplastic-like [Canna indica]|uniref:Phospholipase A1-Ibeta2, chloroplastic-like n=1 Tax=Canna indica TaxID=4628 RepID=A0AAQ3K8H0_9LILI|nr:phospholipase A1-Ibeta2, chloroplastic-like [Canna indica]